MRGCEGGQDRGALDEGDGHRAAEEEQRHEQEHVAVAEQWYRGALLHVDAVLHHKPMEDLETEQRREEAIGR